MTELKKLILSWWGFRIHLTKLLQNLTDTLETTQPLSEDNIVSLKDLFEQLQQKEELLSGPDGRKLEATTNDDEIVVETLQIEEIKSSILSAKAKITHHLSSVSSTGGTPWKPQVHTPPPPPTGVGQEHATRLPKLDIPQFTDDPLF